MSSVQIIHVKQNKVFVLVIRNDAGCINLSELIGQFCDAVIEHNVSVRNDDATPGVNRAPNPSADFDFKDKL